jgi:hypothetical protein
MDDRSINDFVARENIARFKAMLVTEGNLVRQKMLRGLLADEEAKLFVFAKRKKQRLCRAFGVSDIRTIYPQPPIMLRRPSGT